MITNNLFDKVLLDPAVGGADDLLIISGYGSPSLVKRHISILPSSTCVHLIVGMTGRDGIGRRTHEGFQSCVRSLFPGRFYCRYVLPPNAVHVKAYTWMKNSVPYTAFTGSANYSIQAFGGSQLEALNYDSPTDVYDLYQRLIPYTIDCCSGDIEDLLDIYDEMNVRGKAVLAANPEAVDAETVVSHPLTHLPNVTISLLDRQGRLPKTSGLNWGQRDRRDPNQAYIRIPADVYRTDFLPDRGDRFVMLTDDGNRLNCTTAQETNYVNHGKAIHTYENNSIMGQYFRNRIGIPMGAPVELADLLTYGRTDITIYKIDDYTYFMDFSV